jgi:hypothetical protein
MPNGISNRQKAEELRHQKRPRAARAAPLAGKVPPRPIPVPTKPRRASSLPAHSYPTKRSSLGKRQEAGAKP